MEKMNSSINRTWKIGSLWSFLGCFILFLIFNQNTDKISSFLAPLGEFHLIPTNEIPIDDQSSTEKPASESTTTKTTTKKKCKNIFEGKWVYHPEQDPSYDTTWCPFMDKTVTCQKNGRRDSEYEKWRWEASDCDIPLFNGTDMLEKLRNKRLIIVGDSLNRNQWDSLACLLYSSIAPSRAEVHAESSSHKYLKAKDYNCTIEFYWSPFLIEFDEKHESGSKVLVLDKLSVSSEQWRGADVMVFNSAHWWVHPNRMKSWDAYEYKGKVIEEMTRELAYERAMKTWAKWVETNVDPKKTKVFFRSTSPEHKGKLSCSNSTKPITNESFESRFPKKLIEVIERLMTRRRSLQVKYLNITKLSEYRRDAHPSIYTSLQWKDMTSPTTSDCSHWCLPGLPDTWNRLLYASIFFDE